MVWWFVIRFARNSLRINKQRVTVFEGNNFSNTRVTKCVLIYQPSKYRNCSPEKLLLFVLFLRIACKTNHESPHHKTHLWKNMFRNCIHIVLSRLEPSRRSAVPSQSDRYPFHFLLRSASPLSSMSWVDPHLYYNVTLTCSLFSVASLPPPPLGTPYPLVSHSWNDVLAI